METDAVTGSVSEVTTEALALSGIDAFYADSHVLHAVSFTLNAGRVLALLGRNGAGKTTCMNAVIGFLPPRGGEIRLFGEAISSLSPEAISRKGVGLVPQGRRVFPTLTVRENLIVARQPRRNAAATGHSSACSTSFRHCASGSSSTPARSPGENSRCWPSGAH